MRMRRERDGEEEEKKKYLCETLGCEEF